MLVLQPHQFTCNKTCVSWRNDENDFDEIFIPLRSTKCIIEFMAYVHTYASHYLRARPYIHKPIYTHKYMILNYSHPRVATSHWSALERFLYAWSLLCMGSKRRFLSEVFFFIISNASFSDTIYFAHRKMLNVM